MPSAKRLAFWGGWLGVIGMQIGLLAYFGGEHLISDKPYAGLDFDTHIAQTWRVLEGIDGWGQTWVYDVQLLAGQPEGVIFDADNKGWEIWTWVFRGLGLSQGQAFNSYVLFSHLAVAPAIFIAARLFRVRAWASLLAAGLAVLYWNFDSFSHWLWYVGMSAYGSAAYLFLIPLGLFYRWVAERKRWQIVLTAILLALLHLNHPYTFFILVLPMLALYVRAFSSLDLEGHASVVGVALLTIVVNLYWLLDAFAFWHYIVDSSLFAETYADTLVWDVLGLVTEPAATGIIGRRAGFRTVMLVCGVVTLVIWRRRGDDRLRPLAIAFVVLVIVGYLGAYTIAKQTQPYRYLMPAGFIACILTAALVEHAVHTGVFRRFSRGARVTVALLAFPATLYFVGEILYYGVTSLPTPAKLPHGQEVQITALGYPKHASYEYADWHAEQLAAWVREHDDGTGRFLVDGWSWGEQLAWKTDAQILGGFIWRNLEHSWANFFRRRPQGIAKPNEFRHYLDTYAVHWVIVSVPRPQSPWWDANPHLEPVTDIFPFRIYRVKEPAGLIARGPGSVRASTNRIEVTGTDPDRPVVLRYHWMEQLVCEPDCSIEQKPDKLDPVGFVKIPAPHPADFVVSNGY
jgi:hypothetical protein